MDAGDNFVDTVDNHLEVIHSIQCFLAHSLFFCRFFVDNSVRNEEKPDVKGKSIFTFQYASKKNEVRRLLDIQSASTPSKCIYIHSPIHVLWIIPVENRFEKSSYFFDLTAFLLPPAHIVAMR